MQQPAEIIYAIPEIQLILTSFRASASSRQHGASVGIRQDVFVPGIGNQVLSVKQGVTASAPLSTVRGFVHFAAPLSQRHKLMQQPPDDSCLQNSNDPTKLTSLSASASLCQQGESAREIRQDVFVPGIGDQVPLT